MKFKIFILIVIAAVAIGYWLVANQNTLHERREATLANLKGATKSQVIAALGLPDSRDAEDDEWRYHSTHPWADGFSFFGVRSDDTLIIFEGDRVDNAFTEPE